MAVMAAMQDAASTERKHSFRRETINSNYFLMLSLNINHIVIASRELNDMTKTDLAKAEEDFDEAVRSIT
jgi:hypothetical protein